MKNVELLIPAGSVEIFLQAIYSGADAVYLATENYGARAYAKNLSLEELDKALDIAHPLGKKIYVTVNTCIKTTEYSDATKYIDTLYEMGVDGLILADLSLVRYTLLNCPNMETHISTQMGVKDLYDVKFFETMNVKRVVLAREISLDQIKYIKENTKLEIEVFIHGALCVSYSGGCLMSSLIGQRSGNRGRCAQSCRKEYQIYKNNHPLSKFGYYLSMKDLNTSSKLNEILDANIDSLKIEGRMKNSTYVKTLTEEYRKIIDNYPNKTEVNLDNIFHRAYTSGFIYNEDRGKITNPEKQNNEGELIGYVKECKNDFLAVILYKKLCIGDRIRINDEIDYYLTIDKLFDSNKRSIDKAQNFCFINVKKKIKEKTNIFKMVDSSIDLKITNKYKIPLTIYVDGHENSKLCLTAFDGNLYYTVYSDTILIKSISQPLTEKSIKTQIEKLNDTPFYLESIYFSIEQYLFMPIKEINETRRKLVEKIIKGKRKHYLKKITCEREKIFFPKKKPEITCFVTNDEQYEACKAMKIKTIYYKNYSPYVNSKYPDLDDYILVGSYGGIYKYQNKKIISDYTFNVMNHQAVYELHSFGVDRVTLSLELSNKEIKDLVDSYVENNNGYPNLEMICYGHIKLMTMKYCPLKQFNECGKCHNNTYQLFDGVSKFYITNNDCITNILNDSALNLVDNLYEISKYVNAIRLDFTIETAEEIKKIINDYQAKLLNIEDKTSLFDSKKQTHGYFKRPIL